MKRLLLAFLFLTVFFTPVAHAQTGDEKEVVVLGLGISEEEAKKQAYRNAIQSVIGAMVVSETMVENDELVRDKLLSHSDGYVTKAEQVGSARQLEGGLLEVTMRVTVKSQKLRQTLQAENISLIALDGQSLFAKKVTQDENKKDAVAIIQDKIKDLPAALLVAEADPQASEQKSSGDDLVQLTIPVKVSVNKDAYRAFAKDMNKTFASLGFKPKNITVSLDSYNNKHFDVARRDLYLEGSNSEKTLVVAICDILNPTQKSSRWIAYNTNEQILSAINIKTAFSVSISLLDSSDSVIATQEIQYAKNSPNKVVSKDYSHYPNSIIAAKASGYVGADLACIMPAVRLSNGASFPLEEPVFMVVFDLTDDELKSIQSIRCVVSNIAS